jgi:hypothetical protein
MDMDPVFELQITRAFVKKAGRLQQIFMSKVFFHLPAIVAEFGVVFAETFDGFFSSGWALKTNRI